jgi:sigma-B regulation protein RsbU (phosphoserine phosphatase)
MLRTVIQIHAGMADSPRETLIGVHEYLLENIPSGMFITVQLAFYDAAEYRLNFVSAGHNPILLYRSGSKEVVSINATGMPLGIPATLGESFNERLKEVSIKLEPGDLLLMYTDGITEATDRDNNQYGQERLQSFLRERIIRADQSESVADMSQAIVSEIDDFSGFTTQNDDMTFILARAFCHDKPSSSKPASQNSETTIDHIELPDSTTGED